MNSQRAQLSAELERQRAVEVRYKARQTALRRTRQAVREVGLDTTSHHVIIVRQNAVQLMTASMFHVIHLTPGSDDNPAFKTRFN
jgi:hypothetical protein